MPAALAKLGWAVARAAVKRSADRYGEWAKNRKKSGGGFDEAKHPRNEDGEFASKAADKASAGAESVKDHANASKLHDKAKRLLAKSDPKRAKAHGKRAREHAVMAYATDRAPKAARKIAKRVGAATKKL